MKFIVISYLRKNNPEMSQQQDPYSENEVQVRNLYRQLLESWNQREAAAYADLFAEDGNIVGFDGSPVNGKAQIAAHIGAIFADHQTAAYVLKVREVRFLAPEVALLRAVVGMLPPGKADLNPAVNAIQTLLAVRSGGVWRAALLQSTPAQFHSRPEAAQALSDELRQLL
jgi:uncharacterized protein (TIGR02246 family)